MIGRVNLSAGGMPGVTCKCVWNMHIVHGVWYRVCMYSTCGVKANMTLVWMLYSWLVPITPTGYGGLEGRGGRSGK